MQLSKADIRLIYYIFVKYKLNLNPFFKVNYYTLEIELCEMLNVYLLN